MSNTSPSFTCYQGVREIPQPFKSSLLTIGNFDGLHLGHAYLIKKLLSLKKKYPQLPAVALTFHPHPRQILLKKSQWDYLLSIEDRIQQLKNWGLNCVVVQPFTESFASLSPTNFVSKYLWAPFSPKALVVGADFNFAHKRQGKLSWLKEMCKTKKVELHSLKHLCASSNQKISSSEIRTSISRGDMERARTLLGRPFFMASLVEKGQNRGQSLGFPTANLSWPKSLILPKTGVYVVLVQDLSSSSSLSSPPFPSSQKWPAVANLGRAPTFSSALSPKNKLKLEVHTLKNPPYPLYGKTLKVEFLHYLREEKAFKDVSQLQQQIQLDITEALKKLKRKREKGKNLNAW